MAYMNKNAVRVVHSGGSGSGKSTDIKNDIVPNRDRIVIIDVKGEYPRDCKGVVGVRTLPELLKVIQKGWNTGFKVAFVMPRKGDGGVDIDKCASLTEKIIKLLCKVQRPYFENRDSRKITLVVEESAFCLPSDEPKDSYTKQFFAMDSREGGVETYVITQSYTYLSQNARKNRDYERHYRQSEVNDRDRILKSIGVENREALKNLKTHEYLEYREGNLRKGRNKV